MQRHDESSARSPRRLSRSKKVVFALLTTVIVLFLVETCLRLWPGARSAAPTDPFVGFSGYYPLFVPESNPDGPTRWHTADNKLEWFNPQSFVDEKSPQTTRIVCLGGSTTYGRPYDDATSFCGWLRAFLPKVDPSRHWEVINAGGISYASYRVVRVAAELIAHKPDLFIVYTGHNEFLERRTYPDLLDSSELLRDAGGWLSRLQTVSRLRSLFEPAPAASTSQPGAPELSAEVDAILDSSVGLEAYQRDEALHADVLAHYRYNLNRIIDLADDAGVQILLVVPASQLRDCEPFKSEHRQGLSPEQQQQFSSAMTQAREAIQRQDWAAALASAQQALAIDDRYAAAQFIRGRALWALKRYQKAREAFVRARDEDICTLRATSQMSQIVRDVAAERNVPLVDFVTITDHLSAHGVPGAELFLDHVHPTIAGHRQLALAIIDQLTGAGIVHPSDQWGESTIADVTATLEAAIDPQAHARALLNLAKVLSWAGKTDEADRLADQAVEQLAGDAEALYQAGGARFRAGDLAAATTLFEQAVAADPGFAPGHYGVGLMHAEAGHPQEALPHYRRAYELDPTIMDIAYNLANALTKVGETAEAEPYYRRCIALRPDFAPPYNSLGILRAEAGDLTEAIKLFEGALQADPTSTDARQNLEQARALLQQ